MLTECRAGPPVELTGRGAGSMCYLGDLRRGGRESYGTFSDRRPS